MKNDKVWILDEEHDISNESEMADAARFHAKRTACDQVTATATVHAVRPVRGTLAEPEHEAWEAHGCAFYTADNWQDGNNLGRQRIGATFDPELDSFPSDEQLALCDQIVSDHNRAPALLAENRRLREALRECISEPGCAGLIHPKQYAVRRLLAITDIARAALAESEGGK